MDVKEFVSSDVNISEFYAKLNEKVKRLDKKYNFFAILENKTPETRKGKMKGLPVSVKDCICVKGMQSAAGSKILEGYIPPFDATVIERTRNEGGNIIGKTNQDEFGFGTFSINSGFDIPKNPIDPSRSCGGSSGGSAGITRALDMPHVSLSESTGGSIECPSSFCGVVGLKPTYGLVSRYGLIDYANSLDRIGVMAKSVWEAAFGLSAIAGHDSRDSTSLNEKARDYTKGIEGDIKGMKIGVPKEYFQGIDKGVERAVWNSIKKLESMGAEYTEISLKMTEYAIPAYYIIATSEASTNLAKFCGMRYGQEGDMNKDFNEYFSEIRSKYFGDEAKRRILLGTFARMAGYRDQYYYKALKIRTLIINEFKRAFKNYDVLATPTMPMVAPKFKDIEKMRPIEHYMADMLTLPQSMAGLPVLSVPCGESEGMPVGLQLLGDHLQESKILKVGQKISQSLNQ